MRNSSFSDNGQGAVTITSGGDFSDFIISDNLWDGDNTQFGANCGIIMSGVSHSVIRRNTLTGVCAGFEVTGNQKHH